MSPTARRFFGCGLPLMLAVAALATCGLAAFAGRVVVHTVNVPDDGMAPVIRTGDAVTTFNTLIWSSEPMRGTFACVSRPDGFTFRRVVAVPGDRVAVKDGIVFVDGVPHDPALNRSGTGVDQAEITLGADAYFVVADDRDEPDSRQWGPVAREALVGEPQFFRRHGAGDLISITNSGVDGQWLRRAELPKREAAATATATARDRRP